MNLSFPPPFLPLSNPYHEGKTECYHRQEQAIGIRFNAYYAFCVLESAPDARSRAEIRMRSSWSPPFETRESHITSVPEFIQSGGFRHCRNPAATSRPVPPARLPVGDPEFLAAGQSRTVLGAHLYPLESVGVLSPAALLLTVSEKVDAASCTLEGWAEDLARPPPSPNNPPSRSSTIERQTLHLSRPSARLHWLRSVTF
jgi:hypothetical protein